MYIQNKAKFIEDRISINIAIQITGTSIFIIFLWGKISCAECQIMEETVYYMLDTESVIIVEKLF